MKNTNKKRDALLWEIRSPQGNEVHYLFGSMHVVPESLKSKIEQLNPYLESCEIFAAETDLDEQKEQEKTTLQLESGSLRGRMGIKKFEKFRNIILKAYGVDVLQFNHLQPLVVTSFISQLPFNELTTICPDELLWNKSKQLGKEVTGLEIAGRESEIFKNIPMKIQVKYLLATGRNVNKFRRKLFELFKKYENEELSYLYKSTTKGAGGMANILLKKRNEEMAQKFISIAQKKSLFATVGAAHLPGKFGILRKLKLKGFKINPISLLR